MADFNKITVDSGLTVIPANFVSLCFNDNLLLSTDKYSIADHKVTLSENSNDTLTIFLSNGIATLFEYEDIRLNTTGTILPHFDKNDQEIQGLEYGKLLVFINGELQPTNAYTVIDDTTLQFNYRYTNDYDKFFKISIYVSTVNFERVTYTQHEIESITEDELIIPIVYNPDNTLVFINEKKVPFTGIEDTSTASINKIHLNIKESTDEIKSLEVIKFTNNSTTSGVTSLNFNTSYGYHIYGPYDTFNKKVLTPYNAIFRFKDQVKLLIDNIRQGFIIKEVNGFGEAVVVDDIFETTDIKCLITNPFVYTSYTSPKYYLEVPEVTSILKYLSNFDKKYTFLPEILSIFQKLLLNELNDSIQRLRDTRNIHKVDSVHINKLFKLLGFDANIKELTIKQRRELLEELTEFYRRVGTRNAYNLVNILQNDLKLISAEQLFTPAGPAARKYSNLYDYYITVINGGQGYNVGDSIFIDSTRLTAKVTDVDENNNKAITTYGVELDTSAGYQELSGNYTTSSLIEGSISMKSTPTTWDYTWDIQNSVNCAVGDLLKDPEGIYSISVDGVNNGQITSYTPHCTIHDVNTDHVNVSIKDKHLYKFRKDISFDITYSPNINRLNSYVNHSAITYSADWLLNESMETYIPDINSVYYVIGIQTPDDHNFQYKTYRWTGTQYEEIAGWKSIETPYVAGEIKSIILDAGEYSVDLSGGGGAGAAADGVKGNNCDVPATNGYEGQRIIKRFTLSKRSTVYYIVGQGGGRVYARGHSGTNREVRGKGFEDGELGMKVSGGYHRKNKKTYHSIGGQGGGSTAIYTEEEGEIKILALANGGDGGCAWVNDPNLGTEEQQTGVKGGLGGNGGTGYANGGGAKGGIRNQNEDREGQPTFWSTAGEDGWIKLQKIPLSYNVKLIGDLSEVVNNETFVSLNCIPEFRAVTTRTGSNPPTFTYTWREDENDSWKTLDERGYNKGTLQEIIPEQESSDLNTYKALSGLDNAEAVLNITSFCIDYAHAPTLNANKTYLSIGGGDVFKVTDPTYGVEFTYTITNPNKNNNKPIEGILSPTNTQYNINFDYIRAIPQVGNGAIVSIQSMISTQRNEDRCYVDFYKKTELGAELKTEIRYNHIDYGNIRTGTPHAPKWWQSGEPDIDYGRIIQGTPNAPDIYTSGVPDINYGYITDKVANEVVEWWEWDRDPIWYPTNHIEVEVKLPVGVDFSTYIDTFVEQFYNIASTVLYIHQITESFFFGRSATTNSGGNNSVSQALGNPFGIATGMPITKQCRIFTSDPKLQYLNPAMFKCSLTIIPTPYNATVTIKNEKTGEVLASGTGTQTVNDIIYETDIEYIVSTNGYQSKGEVFSIKKDITKYVRLKSDISAHEVLEIVPVPSDATVTLDASGAVQRGNSIAVSHNTPVTWSVSKEGYITQQGIYNVLQDDVLTIRLK